MIIWTMYAFVDQHTATAKNIYKMKQQSEQLFLYINVRKVIFFFLYFINIKMGMELIGTRFLRGGGSAYNYFVN